MDELSQARVAMDTAFDLWSISDGLYEAERWLQYQAAVERYNAIVAQAKGHTEVQHVVLPWVNVGVGA